jgi:hypothetical protein
MDKTVHQIIQALSADLQDELRALGDFPKDQPFDHGLQVGTYRGLQKALACISAVLNDEAEEEVRR